MNDLMLEEINDQPRILSESLHDLRGQARNLQIPSFGQIVLTGSGDSLFAAMAVEHLLSELLKRPTLALPSMSASRFTGVFDKALVVAVSVSGEVVRTHEAARAAKNRGSFVVAVVSNPDSTLAAAADACLIMPTPMTRQTPHTRDYTLTLLALAVLGERLAGIPLTPLEDWPSLVGSVVSEGLAWAATLLPAPQERTVWFLGAGPDRGTAAYGALKFWEAGGSLAAWDELEEYGHGTQLVSRPGDDVVLLAPGPARSRALELIPGLRRMGLRPLLIDKNRPTTTRAGRDDHDFVLPDLGDWRWSPFLSCLPLQALAYVFATHRGIDTMLPLGGKPHGQTYEDVHHEWMRLSTVEIATGDRIPD
jgi:glucosamine 6-phosphate synthetase-like amidotransferase/phosphosugar isomerase protein